MTNDQIAEISRTLENVSHRHALHSRVGRKQLASELQMITNYFSVSEMHKFVDEMSGLNLGNKEDREIFKNFLFCWLQGGI